MYRKWAGIARKRRSGGKNVAQVSHTSQRGRSKSCKSAIFTRLPVSATFARSPDAANPLPARFPARSRVCVSRAGVMMVPARRPLSGPQVSSGKLCNVRCAVTIGISGAFGSRIGEFCSFFEQISPTQALGTPKPVARCRQRSVHRRDLTSAAAISGYLSLPDRAATTGVR